MCRKHKIGEGRMRGGGENTLDMLEPGQGAVISRMNACGGMRRRLSELGFLAGERVECVLKSPLGDPRAYLVRGTVTALRGRDAAQITARTENEAYGAECAAADDDGSGDCGKGV